MLLPLASRDARVTCIDSFEGGLEHRGGDFETRGLEHVFDRNVALVDSTRVRKLVDRSQRVLPA